MLLSLFLLAGKCLCLENKQLSEGPASVRKLERYDYAQKSFSKRPLCIKRESRRTGASVSRNRS